MFRLIILLVLSTMILASEVHSDLEIYTVSDSALDCDRPAVAQGPGGWTMVGWQDAGGQVWTQVVPGPIGIPDDAADPEPVHHGPGVGPRVAYTWFGFLVAWIDGSRIYYRYGTPSEFPDPAQFVDTGLDLSHAILDVWGISTSGYNVAWIVFEVPGAAETERVMMLRLTKGQPEGPVMLAENTWYQAYPQVTAVPGWPEPLARVYYVRDDLTLGYRSETSYDDWQPEIVVPFEIFGSEFDAAGGPLGIQAVLALGPLPTCPCGDIFAVRQEADGDWPEPEEMTVEYAFYNWPTSPCVRIDAQGRTHAFWMQRTTSEEWVPLGRTLEYWVRDEAGWTSNDDLFVAHNVPGLGIDVAMDLDDLGHPAFAWTVKDTVAGVPQPRQILLGRIGYLVAVDDGPPPAATLDAWPNPFNPALSITGTLPAGSEARLAVHDLAGRRVRSLAIDAGSDGHFTAGWDGRDDAGRASPSGVYVLRLGAGEKVLSRRVVLAR
jgi:hypothetical protein